MNTCGVTLNFKKLKFSGSLIARIASNSHTLWDFLSTIFRFYNTTFRLKSKFGENGRDRVVALPKLLHTIVKNCATDSKKIWGTHIINPFFSGLENKKYFFKHFWPMSVILVMHSSKIWLFIPILFLMGNLQNIRSLEFWRV